MVTKDLQTLNIKFDQVMFNSLVFTWERKFEVMFGIFFILVTQINFLESYLDIYLLIVPSKEQARLHSVIPLISVSLFINNFQHFVNSELFTFLVQVKLAWSSLFSSLQQVPRSYMIVYFTSLWSASKLSRHKEQRKSTDVRYEMFISIHIKKTVHMNSLFLKDANLNLKYSQSRRDLDFQCRDRKKSSRFSDACKSPLNSCFIKVFENFALDVELQKLGKSHGPRPGLN